MNFSRNAKALIVCLVLLLATAAVGKDSLFDRQLDNRIALLQREIGKPKAFIQLHSIWDAADFARWDGRIPDVLAEIVASPEASPLLKGHSLWFLREVDRRKGDFDAARQKQAQLGFIVNWLIIGPFDNEGMAGFDLAYPPEEEINLAETYNGKERPVAWWEYPNVSFDCTIDLKAAMRPDSKTFAYALACVFSPERQPVAVRVGSDDCAKVWVGGRLVHANRDCHLIGLDQAVAPATLEQGWNKLLLKVCQDEGAWAFRLRLTAPDGSSLPSLQHASGKGEVAKALEEMRRRSAEREAGDAAEKFAIADPIAEFENLVEAHPDRAEYHASLSFLYSHASAFDRNTRADVRELEKAAELAPENWRYHFRLGQLQEDENKKRVAYEKALELNPDHAPSHARLGKHYAKMKLERKSAQHYRQAVEKGPSYYPAALGLAKYLSTHSQKPDAARMLEELLAAYPDTPYLLSQAVTFAPYPTPPQDVQKRCEAALRFNFCDRTLRDRLLANCYERGDLEGALRQLCIIEQVNPMDTAVLLDHAGLLAAHGRYDEAMALIDRALRICPEDDLASRRKGELLIRQGKREEGLTWLQRSFAVKPQNAALRQYIEFLKPKEKPFEDDYKADAAKIIGETPSKVGEAGDSAVYLFELWIREVHPNGLSNSYHQEIVRILSEAGVEDFRLRRAVYRPDTHEVQVKAARVFKRDGRVINADGPFSYPLGGEERIYYDLEAAYVRLDRKSVV